MKKTIQALFVLVLALSLGACSLGSTPTQEASTPNIEPTLNAARTEAAETVAAQISSQPTETSLPATATLAPSATPVPTNTTVPTNAVAPTNTFVPATNTPVATVKPVIVITNTPTGFGCSITASSGSGTKSAGEDFDGRWTLKNTGSNIWNAGSVDYKYYSGTKLQKKADVYDLPSNVAVGDSIELVVDMTAPTTAGTYTDNWIVVDGATVICNLSVQITVK